MCNTGTAFVMFLAFYVRLGHNFAGDLKRAFRLHDIVFGAGGEVELFYNFVFNTSITVPNVSILYSMWCNSIFKITFNKLHDEEEAKEVLRQASGAIKLGAFIIWMPECMDQGCGAGGNYIGRTSVAGPKTWFNSCMGCKILYLNDWFKYYMKM